jgi:hypothetical protein
MSELTVGTLSGLSANNFVIDVASGSKIVQPGAVLQVVSTTKTDTFTTSSTSFVDITGLSVSITPQSASSKILIIGSVYGSSTAGTNLIQIQLLRDSTGIGIGDAAGSRTQVTSALYAGDTAGGGSVGTMTGNFFDLPNTTSALTYKFQVRSTSASNVNVNRSVADADSAVQARAISSITLMEIAG